MNFAQQTVITDPDRYQSYYEALPSRPSALLQAVQGLIIHGELGKLYGVTFSKRQSDEELLRTIPQLLERIQFIDPRPLTVARPPQLRLTGMCRDYALLLVSFLRHQGIPARVRVGFADYFQSPLRYEDHWVAEYYSTEQERWIRVDAQLDARQKEHYAISFDTEDMPVDAGYRLGGDAWRLCRSGQCQPDDFGYNKNWKGWHSIKGNLLHDVTSLLGVELLPWDLWTTLSTKKYNELTRAEMDWLDEAAEITSNPTMSETELAYLQSKLPDEYMEAIHSQLKCLGVRAGAPLANPDALETPFPLQAAPSCVPPVASPVAEDCIRLTGGRQNNLKNIDVVIPKGQLTVITGVSGSGKSSLAFDTIYAEGKRRYLDTMSHTRMQDLMEKPDFDSIQGLTPTIAIEQKKGSQNPRSTVGTLTGIVDQLRMLYVAIGTPYCPYCALPVQKDGKSKNRCPRCRTLFPVLTVSTFNPNAHTGACPDCNGLGVRYEVNPDAIVIDESRSVLDGATAYFGKLRGKKPTGNWMIGELYAIAADQGVDLNTPWRDLPDAFVHAVLYGTGDKIYHFKYNSGGREAEIHRPASGAIAHIQRLFRASKSDDQPQKMYMREVPCPACVGEGLGREARYTTIGGYRLSTLMHMPIHRLNDWVYTLQGTLSEAQTAKVAEILPELRRRMANLIQVGVSYLTLARTAPTLSGGELQRVRLSSQLGNDLIGLTYVLDEPSIGLHARDHHRMIATMKQLSDRGNTVIVVEHDRDTMEKSDYLIDMGPGAGVHGGEVVAAGTVAEVKRHPYSLTGRYLRGASVLPPMATRMPTAWLTLKGCTRHNLKNIDVAFPLHVMCCITGVSGSGKSSLVFGTLLPALEGALRHQRVIHPAYQSLTGYESIDGLVEMDQSPIGKSSRSIPATYMGVWDAIRARYAQQPQAVAAGLSESHFSFNAKEGQCPVCEGQGQIKVVFPYMADTHVTCSECRGTRYQPSVLSVRYREKSIAEVLQMDVSEAADFFSDVPDIASPLRLMEEVGLSYLKLGQNTATLSGGEAQRLKLAKELSGKPKKHMAYVLDEPTTGLHFQDIQNLMVIFRKLTEAGHSLFIIEHNTDVIRAADWIIDIGPEGGAEGGHVVAVGTPDQIRRNPASHTGKYL